MKNRMRTGIVLGACLISATAALSIAYSVTKDRIERTQHQWLSTSLYALLPEGPFDNDPLQSVRWLDAAELDSTEAAAVYPVYKNQRPYAAVLSVTTLAGYNGKIALLLGVNFSGNIIGVRVTEHSETPGLGDDIELRRSDWVTGFNDLSLLTTENSDWAVKKAGGQFDAFTGATITPRAVIKAVHDALQWYSLNRSLVFPT